MIGFFHFYTSFYDPDNHVITASHPTLSLLPISNYLEELQQIFGKVVFLKDTFIKDVRERKWAYLVVDPFDKTYNPAKLVLSHSYQEEFVFEAMASTLDCLVEEGQLLLEMTDEDFSQRRQEKKKA